MNDSGLITYEGTVQKQGTIFHLGFFCLIKLTIKTAAFTVFSHLLGLLFRVSYLFHKL